MSYVLGHFLRYTQKLNMKYLETYHTLLSVVLRVDEAKSTNLIKLAVDIGFCFPEIKS